MARSRPMGSQPATPVKTALFYWERVREDVILSVENGSEKLQSALEV